MKLTDTLVGKLTPPDSGNRLFFDDQVRGLAARVTAAGARSWVLRYRSAGRQRAYTLGSFPDWSTTQARKEAQALKRRVDTGEDPMGQRHTGRAAPTVCELCERFIEEYARQHCRPRTVAEYQSLLIRMVVPKLGTLRVDGLTPADIQQFHRDASKQAPIRANQAAAVLKVALNKAIDWGLRADNPASRLRRNPQQARQRFLSQEELRRLLVALDEATNRAAATALRLLLLTGARRNEVLHARWSEFDLSGGGVWTKPAAATKQKRIHRVPLNRPALALLERLRADATGPELFPGPTARAVENQLRRCWVAVCLSAGITDCRIHDIRHSFASFLVSSGHSLPMIGELLGHSQPATTARYAHLHDAAARTATELVGAIIANALRDTAGGLP